MKHKKIKSSKSNENIYTDSNDSFSKNYINNNINYKFNKYIILSKIII